MTRYRKTTSSVAKKKFAHFYALSDNASEAVRKVYPHLRNSSQKTIQNKGSRLLSNAIVLNDIQMQKERMEVVAGKAVNRIENIIDTGKDQNALTASIYAYNQVHGKPTQRIHQSGAHVFVSYDLSGGNAPPIPKDVLEQLA
jgi:hypothetical protein